MPSQQPTQLTSKTSEETNNPEAAGGAVADLERLFATFPGDFGELQHQADIRFGERGELINGIGHETVNLSLRV